MLQRSSSQPSEEGPLIADAARGPSARRRRSRTRVVIASAGIGVIAAVAAVAAVTALGAARVIPAPTLTPVARAAPSPSPLPGAQPVGETRTDTLSGQGVWLALPSGAASGVAYLLPDAAEDPSALLGGATAEALLADGWAVATGDLTGRSWGSPASTSSLVELRDWVDSEVGILPALYVGAGMGSTTALTSLTRRPDLAVSCWYAIAPITDLAALAGAQPAIREEIRAAWGGVPAADDNPVLKTASLPTRTVYRVVAPSAPQERLSDANAFTASLEESGHTVTSVKAPENATSTSLTRDLMSFSNGCRP